MSFKFLFTVIFILYYDLTTTNAQDDTNYVLGQLQCNFYATIDIDSDECLSNAIGFSTLTVPSSGTPMSIPCGTCVTMDIEDGSTVDIPGGLNVLGRLHFPSSAHVIVRTTAVFVQGTWSMKIPDENKTVKISMYGAEEQILYPHDFCCDNTNIFTHLDCDASCLQKQNLGIKPFAVAGGKINIRAIDENCPSWTTLKDMDKDSNSIMVDTSFARCLRAGDDLLITSDGRSYRSSNTFTVSSVNKINGEVILEETIPGILPSEAGPGEAMFAVEVALLRRDVIFEAETDPHDELRGGHSIIFETPNTVQVIEGVKFDNFGQAGNIGRYPIHFHISGYSPSLVSKNVIINSNQRCVVIHSTDNVLIDDNVAYNTHGHCFSLEIGDEKFNTFSKNLGANTLRLNRVNKQSDSNNLPQHHAATFWVTSVENTFTGNIAAGSASLGFWFELTNKTQNQLNAEAFKDNVAHSCHEGFLTYKSGWKPTNPAIIDGFKAYKNVLGFRCHVTGNFKFINSVFADNIIGITYGVWNVGVTLEDSTIIDLTQDAILREGDTCTPNIAGIETSINSNPERYNQIALNNVDFVGFVCNSKIIKFYDDDRLSYHDMGDPLISTSVTLIDSDESTKPIIECDDIYRNVFMEDYDGVFGPSGKGAGFIIRDNDQMKAFLPNSSCQALPYDNDNCSAFCEGVCLRQVRFEPFGTSSDQLMLTNQDAKSYTYDINSEEGKFIVVLPAGQYKADFLDGYGNSIVVDCVSIETVGVPRCTNHVTSSDFTFKPSAPTPSPTAAPSKSINPTYSTYYNLVSTNLSCPNNDSRLFDTSTSTLEGCYNWCFDEPTCEYFTYNPSSQRCLGCNPFSVHKTSSGYETYQLTFSKYIRSVGVDLKCSKDNKKRLFQATKTFEECYEECYDHPACKIFSHRNSDCMGCVTDALSSHNGFKAYALESFQEFPYSVVDLNKKCPKNNRLSKTTESSRDDCYNKCKFTCGCKFFTYSENDKRLKSSHRKQCMLCTTDDSLESDTMFHTYRIKNYSLRST